MAITQRIQLSLIPNGKPQVLPINQNDTGTGRIIIDLGYEPDNLFEAYLQGTRADGGTFSHEIVDIADGVYTCDLYEDMSSAEGDGVAQIVITDADGRTGTQVFILRVQKEAKE